MSRAAAELELVRLLNSCLPEYALLMGRLHNDRFLTPADSATMIEAKRLMEEASARLLLRNKTDTGS